MLDNYLPQELVNKKNESELFVEFKNASILTIKGADEPDSLRGIDFAGLGIDEWALMKPTIWEEILRPVIAQDINRKALFAFTPKGRNHAYRYFLMAKNNPEWLSDFLPASISNILPQEELVKLRKELPERMYQQELECEFLEDVASVFRNIRSCVAGRLEEPRQGLSYIIGVDLARTEDFTVLICLCRETRRVVAFDRFQEVSWHLQKERIIQMARKYNNAHIFLDSTGVGDPIEEDLTRARVSVEGIKFTNITKQELIEKLILTIEQRLITFPDIEPLINELESFEYELTPQRNIRYTAPEGLYDDCVIALGLAVLGMKSFIYGGQKQELRQPNYRFRQPINIRG